MQLNSKDNADARTWILTAISALGIVAISCEDAFTPYNELEGFRVLAVQAEPPAVAPGSDVTLRALVHASGDAPIRYRWSWCPLTSGAEGGFECAFTAEQLQQTIDEASGGRRLQIPPTDLGTSSTAVMRQEIPGALLAGACQAFFVEGLPVGVGFECDQGIEVTVRLEAERDGEVITAIKTVRWVVDTADVHSNPSIEGMAMQDIAKPEMPEISLDSGSAPELALGAEYTATLSVRPDEAEVYLRTPPEGGAPVQRRESLTFTWFVESGEMESSRTSFIESEIPLDVAKKNKWTAPTLDPLSGSPMRFYVVVRDGRGGLSWIRRVARFGAAQ